MDALKSRLSQALTSTDIGVQACPLLPDSTRSEWNLFYASSKSWTQTASGFFSAAGDANQGEGYENELFAWQKRLLAAGCSVPNFDPNPPSPPGSDLVKWGVVAIVAIAGAFVVSKVAEVVVDVVELAPKGKRA